MKFFGSAQKTQKKEQELVFKAHCEHSLWGDYVG
jgi:hypothetical protein